MKNKSAIAIFGILLIGIISAGLVNYLSNTITGSVEVKGPVFYAGKNSSGDYKLWINNLSEFNSENNGSYISISESESRTFLTEEFDKGVDFYSPEIKLSVQGKLVNESLAPKRLELEFGYYTQNPYGDIYPIGNCTKEVTINSANWETKSITCFGNGELENIKGFYYKISGMGTGEVKINVQLNKAETKAEILGVAE